MSFNKLGFGITASTMDSGLNVVTKKIPGNLVWVSLMVRDGSIYDPPGQNGLGHILEHCIFDGAKARVVTDQFPLLSDHSINWLVEGLGGQINGLNSYQSVTYIIDCNRRDVKTMVDLLLRIVMFPKLSDHSVNYQRNVVCAELARDEENTLYGDEDCIVFRERLRAHLFSSNPIRNSQGGKREEVQIIKPAAVRQRFASFYAPNNAALMVLSQFDHRFIVGLIADFEKNLGEFLPAKIKRIPRIDPAALKEKKLKKQAIFWENEWFKHLVVGMGYRAPTVLHRDSTPVRILNAVLGLYSFSRLYAHFREKRGYSYFAESNYFRTSIHGEFVVHANFHPKPNDKPRDIIDEVQEFVTKQLREIRSGKISEEEFEQAKRALYSRDRKFHLENPESVRKTLIEAFEANNFSSPESVSASIERELGSALRVKNCSLKRFLAGINRQIDPERYVMLVSGPPGCYSS